jgi:hypothetical protein
MTYLTQSDIAHNNAMFERVAQAATDEGQPDSDTWTRDNRRIWAAAPGWGDAWASALASHPPPAPGENSPAFTIRVPMRLSSRTQ